MDVLLTKIIVFVFWYQNIKTQNLVSCTHSFEFLANTISLSFAFAMSMSTSRRVDLTNHLSNHYKSTMSCLNVQPIPKNGHSLFKQSNYKSFIAY